MLYRRRCHRLRIQQNLLRAGAAVFAGGAGARIFDLPPDTRFVDRDVGAGFGAIFAAFEQKFETFFEIFKKTLYFFERMV